METPSIENVEAVVAIYGSWPAFHDAEVLSVELHRGGAGNAPTLELVLADVDGPTRDSWRVALRFTGIRALALDDFNEQNVLFDLQLSPLSDGSGWETVLASSYGLSGVWESSGIRVVSVTQLS